MFLSSLSSHKSTLLKDKMTIEETFYAMKITNELSIIDLSYELSMKFISLKQYSKLTMQEQCLLGTIWNNYINKFRKSWKNLNDNKQIVNKTTTSPLSYNNQSEVSLDSISVSSKDQNIYQLINSKIKELESTISVKCMEIISDCEHLLDKAKEDSDDRAVINYTMIYADFMSYYAEIADQEEYANLAEKADKLYKETFDKSLELDTRDYLYLNIAYNYSEFLANNLNQNEKAFEVSSTAFNKAQGVCLEETCCMFSHYHAMLENKLIILKTELIDNE